MLLLRRTSRLTTISLAVQCCKHSARDDMSQHADDKANRANRVTLPRVLNESLNASSHSAEVFRVSKHMQKEDSSGPRVPSNCQALRPSVDISAKKILQMQ